MSAVCDYCHLEMLPGVSCTTKTYTRGDEEVPRLPYDPDEPGNCHDCNCPADGFHHPGCDMERCSICSEQAIACDCFCSGEAADGEDEDL